MIYKAYENANATKPLDDIERYRKLLELLDPIEDLGYLQARHLIGHYYWYANNPVYDSKHLCKIIDLDYTATKEYIYWVKILSNEQIIIAGKQHIKTLNLEEVKELKLNPKFDPNKTEENFQYSLKSLSRIIEEKEYNKKRIWESMYLTEEECFNLAIGRLRSEI